MDVCNINFNSLYLASWRCKQQLGEKQNNIYTTLTSLTEPEYCKGPLTTAHPLRHEGMKIVKEVEPDILVTLIRSSGTPEMNLSVPVTIAHRSMNPSWRKAERYAGDLVSARTRAKGSKPDSQLVRVRIVNEKEPERRAPKARASRRRRRRGSRRRRRRESRRRRRRGDGVWGGGVPLPTGGGVWGGGCASPEIFF